MNKNKFEHATDVVKNKTEGNAVTRFFNKLNSHEFTVLSHITLTLGIIVLFLLLIGIFTNNHNEKVIKIVKVNPTPATVELVSDSKPATVVKPVAIKKSAPVATAKPKTQSVITATIVDKYSKPTDKVSITVKKTVTPKTPVAKNCVPSGDITIDGDFPASKKLCSKNINGNLYLQNMNKYILPCGVIIDGDLFVRDVAQLHFCQTFTVKGNIYVSHKSSFGPIPKGAKIGGQIIL